MPRFKLIATDLDDTLLNDQLEVSPENSQALKKAMELGTVVTIATGRMFRSALPIALGLGIRNPIIAYQGALIKDTVSGEVLWHRPVPLDLAHQVLKAGYRANVHMNVYLDDNLFVDDITPEGKGYANLAEVEMTSVGNLLEFLTADPSKILFIAEPSFLDRLKQELQEVFGDSLYITKSKPNYLEFMHREATKKHALQSLADRFGIRREEIMAFGDSYNDLDMLEFAGFGIAMGNGVKEVKETAKYVTANNNEDGVAKAIKKFLLREQR